MRCLGPPSREIPHREAMQQLFDFMAVVPVEEDGAEVVSPHSDGERRIGLRVEKLCEASAILADRGLFHDLEESKRRAAGARIPSP